MNRKLRIGPLEVCGGASLTEPFCLAFDLHWCMNLPRLAINLGPLYLNVNRAFNEDEGDG